MSLGNADLEKELEELPEIVSNSLVVWRTATLDRERLDASLYLKFKGEGEKRTSDEIKAMIRMDGERYMKALDEIKAESAYNLKYELLMSKKLMARLRTAF